MAITDYGELKDAVAAWIGRADLTDLIPDFITLAEASLNKTLRDPRMVTTDTVTITTGNSSVALPADVLELCYVQVDGAAAEPLTEVDANKMAFLRRFRLKTVGDPVFYSVTGRTLKIAPASDGGHELALEYYQLLDIAADDTNAVLTHNPDLYLYMSLFHAGRLVQDEQFSAVMDNTAVRSVIQALQSGDKLTLDSLKRPNVTLEKPSASPAIQPPPPIPTT